MATATASSSSSSRWRISERQVSKPSARAIPAGQWLTRLLGLALASQAWVAWVLRNEPHLGVAKGLAFYQLASATADWIMWIWLADDGVFSNGGTIVVLAIITHYLLGLLLVRAIVAESSAASHPGEPATEAV